MYVFPQNTYVEILTAKAMVLGDGAFGRDLGHEDGALIDGITVFINLL